MAFRRAFLALIALAVGAATGSVLAGDHPDFTGTWKMNETAREPNSTGPREVVFKITHQDPEFSYEATGRQSNYAAFSEAHSFTTDGKVSAGDAKVKIVAQWQGQVLRTRALIDGDEFMVVEYRLSADGQQMTRDLFLKGKPLGRETYDRQ